MDVVWGKRANVYSVVVAALAHLADADSVYKTYSAATSPFFLLINYNSFKSFEKCFY